MLDLMNPVLPGRDFGGAGRDAGFELGFWHSGQIGFGREIANLGRTR
jgi:hypothetical protein